MTRDGSSGAAVRGAGMERDTMTTRAAPGGESYAAWETPETMLLSYQVIDAAERLYVANEACCREGYTESDVAEYSLAMADLGESLAAMADHVRAMRESEGAGE